MSDTRSIVIFTAMQRDFTAGTHQRWTDDPATALQSLDIEPNAEVLEHIPCFYTQAKSLHQTLEAFGK